MPHEGWLFKVCQAVPIDGLVFRPEVSVRAEREVKCLEVLPADLLQDTHYLLCTLHGVRLHASLPAVGIHYAWLGPSQHPV